MEVILLLPILYAAAVVQTSLGDLMEVGRVAPDLLALAAVLWLVTTRPSPWALLIVGAIGLLEDLISPGRIGLGAIGFLGMGYGIARVRSRLRLDAPAWQVLTVWVAVTLVAFWLAAGKWVFNEAAAAPGTLATGALGVGVYTAGVSLPVAMVLGWVRQPSRQRQRRLAGL